ncbi:MAG: hypothetical protein WC068_08630 [Caulobacter sp.]
MLDHVGAVVGDIARSRTSYDAALAADGAGDGAPGLRPHDHPGYHGAIALDPDGLNIEAVRHVPE